MEAKGEIKSVTLEAVVIRADGTRENLGVVSYWHKSWWRRALFSCRKMLKEIVKWRH